MAFATEQSGSNGSLGTVSSTDDSKYVAHNLIMNFGVSMALKAVLELGIPDILANAEVGKPLSAEEIVAQLPTKPSSTEARSSNNLRRLLRHLVLRGLFTESLNDKKKPVFGLTKISEWFTTKKETNYLPIAAEVYSQKSQAGFPYLRNTVLDGGIEPFKEVYGMSLYEYFKQNPELGARFQNMMKVLFKLYAENLVETLQQSKVLEGVKTLVDVGGGNGPFVAQLVAQNPHIDGINFDMPNVIATAPSAERVRHVGGNFFEQVPSGDAMLLKLITHNYSDEDVVKILQNCFKALPMNGKVIIIDVDLRDTQDLSFMNKVAHNFDIMMLTMFSGGQERTKQELDELLREAGFSRSSSVHSPNIMGITLGFKE